MKVRVFKFKIESYCKADGSPNSHDLDTQSDIEETIEWFIHQNVQKVNSLKINAVTLNYPSGGTKAVYLYYTMIYEEKE